jgi:outer membrane protein assembly factor BamB
MFRRPLTYAVVIATLTAGGLARAQTAFPRNLIPGRAALERLGLERHWFAVVPFVETERLLKITISGDLLFAQTSYAMLHTFEAESGRLLWSAQLGERTGFARGVAANSFAVFASNADVLFALDRRTGRTIWRYATDKIPTSPPACDEQRAMIGFATGKIYGYDLKTKDAKGNESILTSPVEAWNWQTNGAMHTRPLPAENFVAFGSDDGRAYVSMAAERTPLFRIVTGGPIGEGFAGYGTRTLLIPSADNNLYAVDLFTAKVFWTFPSAAPILQEPSVCDQDIYVINSAGNLSSLDPATGVPRWTTWTAGGQVGGGPQRDPRSCRLESPRLRSGHRESIQRSPVFRYEVWNDHLSPRSRSGPASSPQRSQHSPIRLHPARGNQGYAAGCSRSRAQNRSRHSWS